jgi:hypothetical protein
MSDPTRVSPLRDKNRAYYLANRDAILARSKAWRESHLEYRKAYTRRRQIVSADKIADYKLRKTKGITLADHAVLLASQGGVCAICRRPESARRNGRPRLMAVDHDHRTGAVRGLLCNACNTALGLFGDDIAVMEAAIAYLAQALAKEIA